MIKIRYADLSAGLHVQAECSGRSTIIYLVPGLTHIERQAALLRARRNATMGRGPRLPAAGVAAAVVRDRVWTTVRNGAAAVRAHPLLLVVPLVLIAASAALGYVRPSAVSITFPQAAQGREAPSSGPPAPSPSPSPSRSTCLNLGPIGLCLK